MSGREWQIKEQMCEIGRRVWIKGYVASNDGNFSFRVGENRVLATPTMISKGFMQPEDIVTLDLSGRQLDGHRQPTSETRLHLGIYQQRPEVKAVIHAHPPHATAFAVAGEPVPKCILPEVEIFLGEIPIARYETPGSQAFADTLKPFLGDFSLFLLANHGALALGEDLEQAYYRMETVDHYCRILLYTMQLGQPKQISQEKMAELFQLKERLGFYDRRTQAGGDVSCRVPSPTPPDELPRAPKASSPSGAGEQSEETIQRIVRAVLREKGLFK